MQNRREGCHDEEEILRRRKSCVLDSLHRKWIIGPIERTDGENGGADSTDLTVHLVDGVLRRNVCT